jgi:carbon storage regulator
MLVLSRQRDESIVIGYNVVVTIVDIRGDKVRLGIEAPAEIPVHRQEVFDAIQRENRRPGNSGSSKEESEPPKSHRAGTVPSTPASRAS